MKVSEANRACFLERQEVYRRRGLDHLAYREDLVRRAGPLGGRVLEVGSGRGYLALVLAREGVRFVSTDIEWEMLETTALNLRYEGLLGMVELVRADARALCFADGVFDSVIAVDFVHHLDGFGKVSVEMDRVLGPGGKVIVADFNERGRAIVSAVHEDEGRRHEANVISPRRAAAPFAARGYRIERGGDDCHWDFVAVKPGM